MADPTARIVAALLHTRIGRPFGGLASFASSHVQVAPAPGKKAAREGMSNRAAHPLLSQKRGVREIQAGPRR
jgi:hypothetical protein